MDNVFASPDAQASAFDALAFLEQIYESGTFRFIRTILLIYVIVLVINIILVVIVRDPVSDLRNTLVGQDIIRPKKRKSLRRWEAIMKRLDSDSMAQYKIAVLEADKMTDEILAGIGYKGGSIGERLETIKPYQLDQYDLLKDAHSVYQKIVDDEKYELTKDEANRVLSEYEAVLKGLELF